MEAGVVFMLLYIIAGAAFFGFVLGRFLRYISFLEKNPLNVVTLDDDE